ncbi:MULTISPECIES: TetR/AcrR family transcriptional regulator [unclassified Saccharopolyspora]|uniref:TetR/AcrR family transcriptional regulator n=1 Tax=unclassified Saccharopolyspora TaxID=2646250 RepID=UPI001CD312C0|nr:MULTISPECIES: TetR/AcrR family transcriptional regulator [unclassified Saccharopolyspora]MCA1186486.1 TetR/AcrR family transcriptional regulator [Saccharopolyspora sp. 6T]MCA1282182.1 TetR/AcrR family transcriptional regulator [Saccharopolyspora sp. 7B]
MDQRTATTRLLDAAEELFYARGVQAVGMDEIRAASGVSLKRLYQCFPSKEQLVVGYLRRRDGRWRDSLARSVITRARGAEQVLAVFDWLHEWFSEPGFHGCAFLNSFGELGATSPAVAAVVREHKTEVQRYLATLLTDAGEARAGALAEQLNVLVEGAITTAAITGTPAPAHHARAAAEALLTHR